MRESDPSIRFPQAMILIVLAALGFLACAFFLFVLFQRTRDTKHKTATRTAVDDAASESSEKNVRKLLVPEGPPKSVTAFREGHAGSTAGEVGRAVAGLDATSANGLRMRSSPDR
jgi:hypothetical protein